MEMLWSDLEPGDKIKIAIDKEKICSNWVYCGNGNVLEVTKIEHFGNDRNIYVWFRPENKKLAESVYIIIDNFSGGCALCSIPGPIFEIVELKF